MAVTYWIKLQGSSQPASARVPNLWWGDHGLRGDELVQFESGPRSGRCPFSLGDRVVLAAAGWSRVFAAVELVEKPRRAEVPRWGPRWPWVLVGRPQAWVDAVEQGPKVTEAGLPRSYGGAYQRISASEYESALDALRQRGRIWREIR